MSDRMITRALSTVARSSTILVTSVASVAFVSCDLFLPPPPAPDPDPIPPRITTPNPVDNVHRRQLLSLPLVRQQTEVWCWAATSEMVFRYYGRGSVQCEILSAWLTANCCLSPPHPYCRQGAPSLQVIQQTLFAFGRLTSSLRGGPLSLNEIRNEIDLGRPIIAAYRGAFSGHVVVVYGYDSSGNIYIHDPYYGTFIVPYAATFYYNNGQLVWYDTIYEIRPF